MAENDKHQQLEEVVIREQPGKVWLQLLFAIFMLALSVLITYAGLSSLDMIYAVPGMFGILLFGIAFVYIIRGIVVGRPLMKVNAAGIVDLASISSVGLVEWHEIENVLVSRRFRQTFIDVQLRNEDEVLKRLSGFKRFLTKLNFSPQTSLVAIPLGTAMQTPDEIIELIQPHLQKHGRKLIIG